MARSGLSSRAAECQVRVIAEEEEAIGTAQLG